jgi:hypothetical protein
MFITLVSEKGQLESSDMKLQCQHLAAAAKYRWDDINTYTT